jgi:hypothetical protein
MRNAIERLRAVVGEAGGNKAASAAMANLAEPVNGLVQEMRIPVSSLRTCSAKSGIQCCAGWQPR